MSKPITDLFYGKGRTEFFNTVGKPRQIYEDRPLLQKLDEVLFFPKLRAEVLPSYNFGTRVNQTLNTFPTYTSEVFFEHACEEFAASEVNYLRDALFDVLLCFKNFPQVFIDLYKFYPRFNLKFEELEFAFLDFGSQTPKVLSSLLSELLVRDEPLREAFVTDLKGYGGEDKAYPPAEEKRFTEDELRGFMLQYFVMGERYPVFVEIINLYLKARPKILAACTKRLVDSGNVVSDEFLAQYFVGYYIFKGVSNETLRFCSANADIPFDPFTKHRFAAMQEGESFTEEERQEFIKNRQKYLEEASLRVARDAAMTHEEKVAIVEAREAEWAKRVEESDAWKRANPDGRNRQ